MATDIERKNYSFYMPVEFDSKLADIQAKDKRLSALSKSQAVNFIVSEIAANGKFKIDIKAD